MRMASYNNVLSSQALTTWCGRSQKCFLSEKETRKAKKKNFLLHRLLRLGMVDPGTAREVNQLMDHREEIEVDIIINNKSTIPIITILIIRTTRTCGTCGTARPSHLSSNNWQSRLTPSKMFYMQSDFSRLIPCQ